ncbi:MAG: hypothetical protein D8M58_22205 [Calditrichaeota bacterium]|nr:MAG: hypothetical protein DWQ03_08595 [Calditrichota bacterium]MBL1208127.1 hypothetical protein [Calditrichota bacterium]NOG47966.1 DUF5343 domain-containing protein [Calditrichota bacterium]
MALISSYTEAYGKVKELFSKIRDGQAPEQFTHQILLDLGFKSNKHRAYIPLLKALGFLTPDGKQRKDTKIIGITHFLNE